MCWPAQSPDLYPIENLWTAIKEGFAEQKPTNSRDLWKVVKEAWEEISLKRYQGFINYMHGGVMLCKKKTEAIQRNINYFINL